MEQSHRSTCNTFAIRQVRRTGFYTERRQPKLRIENERKQETNEEQRKNDPPTEEGVKLESYADENGVRLRMFGYMRMLTYLRACVCA